MYFLIRERATPIHDARLHLYRAPAAPANDELRNHGPMLTTVPRNRPRDIAHSAWHRARPQLPESGIFRPVLTMVPRNRRPRHRPGHTIGSAASRPRGIMMALGPHAHDGSAEPPTRYRSQRLASRTVAIAGVGQCRHPCQSAVPRNRPRDIAYGIWHLACRLAPFRYSGSAPGQSVVARRNQCRRPSIDDGGGRPGCGGPRGRIVPAVPERHSASDLGWPSIRAANAGLGINAETIACEWSGKPMPYANVVDQLVTVDELN
jgi:hypothetical protein